MPFRRRGTPEQPGVRRILVGTDLSPTAERAVSWAADMAARYEAELILLRVVTNGTSKATAEAELRAYAATIAPGARPLVKEAEDPAEAIVAANAGEEVDVVVVGSVGMRGRRTFLLGNVPNRVSHAAGCTVVIVNTADVA
jgi:nucleotide-binding universal stress UspA family protein